jgi:hypothetical protein
MATKEENIKDLLAAMKSKKNHDPGMTLPNSSELGKDEGMTPKKLSNNDDGPFGPIKKPSNPFNLKKGGKVSSASRRADGIAQRGKTKGRYL